MLKWELDGNNLVFLGEQQCLLEFFLFTFKRNLRLKRPKQALILALHNEISKPAEGLETSREVHWGSGTDNLPLACSRSEK